MLHFPSHFLHRPVPYALPPCSLFHMAAVDGRVKGGALELQAEMGMKLLKATEASGAEYDSAAAEAYQKEVETRIAKLETESNQLTGKDNKKERSAKGKEIAELKNEHKYVDACKIVKGLEPKFLDYSEAVPFQQFCCVCCSPVTHTTS